MAVLRCTDREIPVPDRCVIGRSRACDLVITGPEVSSQHAVLQWTDARWLLRDLGSLNGTFVGDTRLASGARAPIDAGTQIRFGRRGPLWVLVDAAAPPVIAARLEDATWRTADSGYLTLPEAEAPTLAVYQETGGRWVVDQDGVTRALADRSLVEAGGLWRIYLPSACVGTVEDGATPAAVAELRLEFTVSRDEERVTLVAWKDERRIDLLVRTHHYLLLLLARRRLADRAAGAPPADEGWIHQDDLLTMMRIDENNFHTNVHRARAQLGKAGVVDAATLIERRQGTGMLRLGVATLAVDRGESPRA